jgi:hypothetical protein
MDEIKIQELIRNTEEKIVDEKQKLVDNVEELEKEREATDFLSDIVSDYKKYQHYILQQKEEQKEHLLKILKYLDNLMETQAVTEYTLSHTRNEQMHLVNEIKNLQKDIDQIIVS